MPLLEPWSRISSLAFEGESTFSETDKTTGETVSTPEPSRFKCWLANLHLNKARWEYDEKERRWDSFPFPEPIRYRVEYTPRIDRWLDGAAPYLVSSSTDICDGKTVISEKHAAHPRRKRAVVDDFRAGKSLNQWIIGLRTLPPLLSIGPFRIMAEIDAQNIAAQAQPNPALVQYALEFPQHRVEVVVTWDTARRWFTKVESTRWGVPAVLLDKIRLEGNLTEEEKIRLRTESEIVDTETYEASEFGETAQAELFFPHRIEYVRDARKTRTTKAWRFQRWTANEVVSNDLFHITLPTDCRIDDIRKRQN